LEINEGSAREVISTNPKSRIIEDAERMVVDVRPWRIS